VLDLQKALLQAGHSDWLGKRLFHELSEISRHLSNTAVLLEQNSSFVNGWAKHADTSTEKEVTAAVIKYLKDAVTLEITEIIKPDGSVLCEWNGVLKSTAIDQQVLVFVEAKHCVKAEHLEKVKGGKKMLLQSKLGIMQDWLSGLHEPEIHDNSRRERQLQRQYDEYKRYKNFTVKGAIGGPVFETALQTCAKNLGYLCVVYSGNHYAVA